MTKRPIDTWDLELPPYESYPKPAPDPYTVWDQNCGIGVPEEAPLCWRCGTGTLEAVHEDEDPNRRILAYACIDGCGRVTPATHLAAHEEE